MTHKFAWFALESDRIVRRIAARKRAKRVRKPVRGIIAARGWFISRVLDGGKWA